MSAPWRRPRVAGWAASVVPRDPAFVRWAFREELPAAELFPALEGPDDDDDERPEVARV